MNQKARVVAPKAIWAYGYQISPPQSEDRLAEIRELLDQEHTSAKLGARTWEGRFVMEDKITHILVVTDSPDQDRDVNRRLESALRELQAGYSMTAALAVGDEPAPQASSPGPTEKQ